MGSIISPVCVAKRGSGKDYVLVCTGLYKVTTIKEITIPVVKVDDGMYSILLTGDIEALAEQKC